MDSQKFIDSIKQGYNVSGDALYLGAGMLGTEVFADAKVQIPIAMFNRHGLIAGATGTGKTKSLQVIAEGLSRQGVSVLLMDIKGDMSGISREGAPNPKIDERAKLLGITHNYEATPVEFMSLTGQSGIKMRATVSEFGPVLFSRILDLNDTQGGVVSLVFKYADDNQLGLVDLKDFKKVLQFLTNEGKDLIKEDYGTISTATAGTIIRKVVELEQQGADKFFGEKSFEVDDLCRIDEQGRGYVSVLRLNDIQDKPKLFSTFMLSLLAEVYSSFEEIGDKGVPKLVIFVDEAHLVFNEASKALMDQIETIIKLIRSKGVGVFFCTQNPADIPSSVLGQLGLKVQHALRAFTANDRKAIKMAAENYPLSEYYKTEDDLTMLGIGEAFVTALNEKGIPTPLVRVMMAPPRGRMDVVTSLEMQQTVDKSDIAAKYAKDIDPESAYEILTDKLKKAAQEEAETTEQKGSTTTRKQEKGTLEKALDSKLARDVGRTMTRELTRGLLGVLGLGGKSKKRLF